MDETDTIFTQVGLGCSIVEEINNGEAEPRTAKNDAMYLQPVFSAIQVCTYTVMAAAGIRPAIIVGHSIGEIAAAHCAGCLGIEDATQVCYERAQAQGTCSGTGCMASVTMEEDALKDAIATCSPPVDIAGHHALSRFNVSGASEDIDALQRWS